MPETENVRTRSGYWLHQKRMTEMGPGSPMRQNSTNVPNMQEIAVLCELDTRQLYGQIRR